jgi:hypothetical protein
MSNDHHQAEVAAEKKQSPFREVVLSSVVVVITAGFYVWVMKQHPVGELGIRPHELLALLPAVACLYYFADKVVEQLRHRARASRVK